MDFQPEIIRIILGHLDDVEDLKKCLLTSHEIREIIIKTPELMRRLTLILMHVTWKEKLWFIEKYGFFVRSLKLDDIGFESNEEFMKVLKKTPNLERLIVDDCYIMSERETENNNDDDEQENNDENNDIDMNHAERENNDDDQQAQNMEVVQEEELAPPPAIAEGEGIMEVQDIANEAAQEIIAIENRENSPNNNINVNIEIQQNNEAEAINEAETQENNAKPNNEIEPLNLKYLTHLHLESSTISESIVKSLPDCTTLKTLKLTFYYQEPVTTFTDLLCRQDNLEELNLQGWSEMVFKCLFKEDIREKIKFRLKKFSLECEMSYHVNFSNFLRSQAEHIRELELSCYNINFHYYRMIFNNFQNLEKLNIPVDWFLTDTRVNAIKDCRINTLKELELVGTNDDITCFKTILNIFPNLEVLKCENLQNFSLFGILENFKKLKTIRSENFRCETMLFVKLPSLTTIETGFLYPFAMDFLWSNLAEDCPNLENILIDDIGHFKLNDSVRTEFAIILKNLKHFKKLKKCRIICTPTENTVNHDHDGQENDMIQEHPFYKVNIKVNEKTIKISEYFAQHCIEEVRILRETFKDCDIIEA